jgi:hypothetical protein
VSESDERKAARIATEERCPRCAAIREPGQEYCVECGLHLPTLEGAVPSLRRHWIKRVGWYPGDWIWISAVTLLVAAGGAAVSIVVTTHRSGSGGTTLVASTTTPPATTTSPPKTTTTTPAVTRKRTTKPAKTTAPRRTRPSRRVVPNGRTVWPTGLRGWTIVLGSYPITAGKSAAQTNAAKAARSGLPDVGLLDSSSYASLHPGYYVVFTGHYASQAQAQASLHVAFASGFPGAYPREVSR